MTSFLFYSVLLLVLALLFVIVPVLRYKPQQRTPDSDIRRQKNIEVFQQGLAELEKDHAGGDLGAEDFARLKTELERSFLRDMEDEEKRRQGAGVKSGKLVPALCLLFVPIFSYTLYEVVGSARDLALPDVMAAIGEAETEEAQRQALEDLAAFLQQRFERRDDDIQNGYMLGTLYLELEMFDEATAIFTAMTDSMEAGPDKATVLGQLAQSLYLAAGSQLTPQARQVIDEALALNPNEFAVMSILAIESFINQDFATAVGYWRRQLMQLDAGSRQAAALRDRIARVEELLPELAATGTPAATDGASVTLVVDIDASVLGQVDNSMRLFVYARNADSPMPMPIAAQNLALPADFPFEITLDDSDAAMGLNLSSAENVIVGARLSRSGQATAQPGDIQAVSAPFPLAEQDGPVRLTIRDIVQ